MRRFLPILFVVAAVAVLVLLGSGAGSLRGPGRAAPEAAGDARPEEPARPGPTQVGEGEEGFATLAGHVVDGEGEPVEGASVRLEFTSRDLRESVLCREARTDADGAFSLVQPRRTAAAERLVLLGSKDGCVPARCVLSGPRTDLEIVLSRAHPLAVRVVDLDGLPVEGATVAGRRRPAAAPPASQVVARVETDEEGRARLDLPATEAEISVRKPGWRGQDVILPAVAGRTESLDVVIRRGTLLRGRVVERGTGRALAGVEVRSGDRDPILSDADGRFEILLPPVVAAIRFRAPWHHGPERVHVRDLLPGGTLEREFELEPAGQVAGVVLEASGEPCPGAVVTTDASDAIRAGREGLAAVRGPAARTDASGRFRLEGVPPGKGLVLHAHLPRTAAGESEPVEVRAGGVTSGVVIRLQTGATVVLLPRTPEGGPPSHAQAEAAFLQGTGPEDWELRPGFLYRTAWLANGEIRLWGLERGKYEVRLQARGYRRVTIPLEEILPAGAAGERVVEVPLAEGLSIRGRCEDGDGNPLGGALVTASLLIGRLGHRPNYEARVAADGTFEVKGLEEGEYELSVSGRVVPGERFTRHVSVPAGATDVLLEPLDRCWLEGTVRDDAGQLSKASVHAWRDDASPNRPDELSSSSSLARGSFRLDFVSPGDWWVWVDGRGAGYSDAVRVRIEPGRNVLPPIRLEGPRFVTGYVRGPNGPIADARVVCEPTSATENPARRDIVFSPPRATTDAKGRYRLGPICPGRWTLEISAKDHVSRRIAIEVREGGDEVRQDASLELGARVAMRVVGPDGRRLQAFVGLSPTRHEPAPPYTGRGPRRPGIYTAKIKVNLYRRGRIPGLTSLERERQVELREGETTKLDITLTREEIDEAWRREEERRRRR